MTAAPDWRPGDPVHDVQVPGMSYTPVLSDCCPPNCWHYLPMAHGGGGMRWTLADPVLRFLADGLHVAQTFNLISTG